LVIVTAKLLLTSRRQ